MNKHASLHCRACRKQLSAYINRELTPRLRRRVAVHLDTCSACYAAYRHERDLMNELASSVPLVGRRHTPPLGEIWTAIQADIVHPGETRARFSLRYGMATLMIVLALLLPWLLRAPESALAAGAQPQHFIAVATQTPQGTKAVYQAPPGRTVASFTTLTGQPLVRLIVETPEGG